MNNQIDKCDEDGENDLTEVHFYCDDCGEKAIKMELCVNCGIDCSNNMSRNCFGCGYDLVDNPPERKNVDQMIKDVISVGKRLGKRLGKTKEKYEM